MSTAAIDINDTRALHVAELTRDALRNMGRYIAGAEVLVCGASYRQDVGDTRYSGSELVVRKLTEMGAEMRVHDPYVDHWYELESQDTYPAVGQSWSRFFRNQESLKDIRVRSRSAGRAGRRRGRSCWPCRTSSICTWTRTQIVSWAGGPLAVVDCFGILCDDVIRRYFELGCEVKALGRGHIQRIKEQVRNRNERRPRMNTDGTRIVRSSVGRTI